MEPASVHTPGTAASALHAAYERGELTLHYQPIVSLRDGRIAAVEALLRWDCPERGVLAPEPFQAEAGAMVALGGWRLEQACAQIAEWRPLLAGLPLCLTLKVSAAELRDPGFVETVTHVLARHAIHPRDFVVEVAESVAGLDDPVIEGSVAFLRELGVRIAVADFGTGRASLTDLLAFDADVLKIDGAIVAGLGRRTADTAIVSALVVLGHALGLMVVADGVQTREQLEVLRGLGCDLAQGLASPAPPEDIARVLALSSS